MIPDCMIEFFRWMDAHEGRVPLSELVRQVRRVGVTFDDVSHVAQFNPERYQRNLLHAGPGYHALVLCWRNGQRSPIHDHKDSSCAVKVLRGTATETFFDRAPNGLLIPTRSRSLEEGEICGSQDDDVHQVSNLQPGGLDLVTLHIYSPPLTAMRVYSLTDSRVTWMDDPIFELVDGGGI
ncbi:MAG: cysteine dioxygenase family protein [Phycisphaerae bacterium]|nr:cysteine dioxygenase family protein [Planctomycetia bacterium]MCK6466024.1 cysteine dioxygenase family protein [Phycisphaerae bacterium]MCL4719762.1 cysteine dioxygenase family protein [Phycisphaerae bacterium]NUQ09680.1 cysteine dioxygenase family protein [Phycisphaerae bacterium]GIK16189.1 MAG: hypothetical protein BroJett003_11530 [Planctomycetota bacterium]